MFNLFKRRGSGSDLFRSVRSGNARSVRKIIGSGADVDAVDKSGRTALCLAGKYGYAEIMKILIDAGADVNKKVAEGRTPIYHAIYSGSVEAVKLLIDHGASLDVVDSVGYSPYNYAWTRSQTKVAEAIKSATEGD